jgi:phosphoribosylformylglycinamidine cyclo-ligase
MQPLNYANTGVNYDVLDQFKRHCQRAAGTTVAMLGPHGLTEPAGIRGESAYLVETPDEFLAHVEEGLGTKNLVADALLKLPHQGRPYYQIGIDTVAAIVNDLLTVGALPMVVAMHAAVGSAKWFENADRARDLAEGFAEGCRRAGAVWGGGETPALKGLVNDDAIILLASSGVHANGLTLCRELAARLPQGYLAPLSDGRTYGDALLDPSVIYSPFIAACQRENVPLHYAVHMTGHGWRKLMRLAEPLVYRITQLAPRLPIFDFIAQAAGLDAREMYGTFNMGAGFAVYVAPADVPRCLALAEQVGIRAWQAGVIEKQGARKAVVIEPLGVEFAEDTLQIRD